MKNQPRERILCVDDEPNVLEGLALHLGRRYEVVTAPGGEEGLTAVRSDGPFALIISDMRMPGMDGAAFLAQARLLSPETTRILLTGQTDFDSAIAAVNEGRIFRFLQKPCSPDLLLKAAEAAAEQHRLVTAERILLEETLQGSIRMLTDILALSNPAAFGRAMRAKRHVTGMALKMGLRDRWPLEVAAMLSQVGCVTLPPETVERLYHGRPLGGSELAMVRRLPEFIDDLLANIPRLEPVREILAGHVRRFDGVGAVSGAKGEDLPIGARILKIVLDYDTLESQGLQRRSALDTLRERQGWYDSALLASFEEMKEGLGEVTEFRELPLAALESGMVFAEDLPAPHGGLLMARGQEITPGVLARLKNLETEGRFKVIVRHAAPAPAPSAAPAPVFAGS